MWILLSSSLTWGSANTCALLLIHIQLSDFPWLLKWLLKNQSFKALSTSLLIRERKMSVYKKQRRSLKLTSLYHSSLLKNNNKSILALQRIIFTIKWDKRNAWCSAGHRWHVGLHKCCFLFSHVLFHRCAGYFGRQGELVTHTMKAQHQANRPQL